MNENGKIKLEYCPICGNKYYRRGICQICGYDLSTDYTRFPTVGKIPANTKGPEALRAEYLKKQKDEADEKEALKNQIEELKDYQCHMECELVALLNYKEQVKEELEELHNQKEQVEEQLENLRNQKKQAEIQEKPVVKKTAPKKPKKPKIIAAAIAGVVLVGGIEVGLHLFHDDIGSDETAGAPGFADAEVGDTVVFGSYEQDNDTSNGKEDIEWRVLEKEDDRILVISEYALDAQPYNTVWVHITWETCSLREWLNGTFLEEAFSSDEMSYIPEVTVTADTNPEYDTDPGNDTEDQVFLLSCSEEEAYFSSDEDRMCVPTAYAISQGAYTNDDYSVGGAATCWWWLRSPGDISGYAADVNNDGSLNYDGNYVGSGDICVRPALWVNL